jgi:hypothetical protein
LKRNNMSAEAIAAFNLAVAHRAVLWISDALRLRIVSQFTFGINKLRTLWNEGVAGAVKMAADTGMTPENLQALIALTQKIRDTRAAEVEAAFEFGDKLFADATPFPLPLTEDITTAGEIMRSLSNLSLADLQSPMNIPYIHLLHTLATMGLSPTEESGHFRTTQVHVGNPDLIFPVPSLVPNLMAEFCRQFRAPLVNFLAPPNTPPELPAQLMCSPADLLLLAVEQSHHFVRIHPYRDGNGRVSRLLMNLVLRFVYPPVYLKADKKGRHRYSQALRRADNGKFKPLASLILMSLDDIYDKLLASVTFPPSAVK